MLTQDTVSYDKNSSFSLPGTRIAVKKGRFVYRESYVQTP